MIINETTIQAIDALKNVPVFDECDPRTAPVTSEALATYIAEAEDTVRLYELLHRDEYRPLAAIRHHGVCGPFFRVYFQRSCDTIRENNELATGH